MPKEIADYLNKMGARIPNIKPGKATIEYLTKIQSSTRFWGYFSPYFLSSQPHSFFIAQIDFVACHLLSCVGNSAGGVLLSILATTSSILDHYLRNINAGFSIGLTSVLIIVSTILSMSSELLTWSHCLEYPLL